MNDEDIQQKMDRFREALRGSAVKMTHQRMEIFREVAKAGDHPDAEAIYRGVSARIPSVSLDTIYRALWLFAELGLVTTLGFTRGRVRFDANMVKHHHFVCTKCGLVRDFYSRQFDDLKVPEGVKALGRVERTHVELKGLCARCSKTRSK